MSIAGLKRKLRRELKVIAIDDCAQCGGSGLKVSNNYYAASRKLEVTVEVCPCVKVVPV